MSRKTSIARKSLKRESRIAFCPMPPSSPIYLPSGVSNLEDWLTLLQRGRPASPGVVLDGERVNPTQGTSIPTPSASSEKSALLISSWRMFRESWGIISTESGQNYETWATSLRRACTRRLKQEHLTTGIVYSPLHTPVSSRGGFNRSRPDAKKRPNLDMMARKGLLSTPTANDAKNNASASQKSRDSEALNVQVGGALNPEFVEWMMGAPIGLTDLQPLATQSYQVWWRSFSGRF